MTRELRSGNLVVIDPERAKNGVAMWRGPDPIDDELTESDVVGRFLSGTVGMLITTTWVFERATDAEPSGYEIYALLLANDVLGWVPINLIKEA